MPQSKYSLVIDNISSITRSADIRHEMERTAGRVLEVIRDAKARCALVEFDSSAGTSDDASYAWKKMDGFRMDGRSWKVDWATDKDFDFFEKKWTEGGYETKHARSRSRSRTPSRGDSRQYSDQTPYN